VRLRAPAIGGAAAYAGLAATFAPFSWPMRLATAFPCVILVGVATHRGWLRDGPVDGAPLRALGLATGLVLLAAIGSFQLSLYLSAPRADYPTLSSLAGSAFEHLPVRATAFAAWLASGWYLVRP